MVKYMIAFDADKLNSQIKESINILEEFVKLHKEIQEEFSFVELETSIKLNRDKLYNFFQQNINYKVVRQ